MFHNVEEDETFTGSQSQKLMQKNVTVVTWRERGGLSCIGHRRCSYNLALLKSFLHPKWWVFCLVCTNKGELLAFFRTHIRKGPSKLGKHL